MINKSLLQLMVVTVSLGMASIIHAESAPVFDADSLPEYNDQNQGYPPEGVYSNPQQQEPREMELPPLKLSIEQRLQRVEQQVNNIQSGDSASKMDSLQAQVQTLRNQVEELAHQLEQVQSQQKAALLDMEKRLSQQAAKPAVVAASPKLEEEITKNLAKPPVAKPALAKIELEAPDQPNVAEEQHIYQTAYNLIKAKKYEEAVSALKNMLIKYPSGQFAANAHYWLGELYGLMGKNDLALLEFGNVVKNYPTSPRVSDAQLKIGLLLAADLKWGEAKSAFKLVINRYPGTASSRLAAEQLKQIKQAGH